MVSSSAVMLAQVSHFGSRLKIFFSDDPLCGFPCPLVFNILCLKAKEAVRDNERRLPRCCTQCVTENTTKRSRSVGDLESEQRSQEGGEGRGEASFSDSLFFFVLLSKSLLRATKRTPSGEKKKQVDPCQH